MTNRIFAAFAGLIAFALFGASPAKADWRRAESPNFILYGNLSETELRQRILRLEDFDHLLRIIISVTEPPMHNKLRVYIVANPRDLRTIRQIGPGFYLGKVYWGKKRLIDFCLQFQQ